MKQCPRCGSTYSDDSLNYCLTDGSTLLAVDTTNQPTVVLDHVPAPPTQKLNSANVSPGVSPVFKYVAIGLICLLLLVAGAGIAAWSFWSSRNSQLAVSPSPTPMITNGISTPRQVPTSTASPVPSPTPRQLPKTDPGTTRISFKSGSVGEVLRGSVAVKRVFVLRTLEDQMLTAAVNSPKSCVVFDDGGRSTSFQTSQGDTYLTIRNTCDEPSSFMLSVNVR